MTEEEVEKELSRLKVETKKDLSKEKLTEEEIKELLAENKKIGESDITVKKS
jgi:hypothetical protein